MISMLECAIAIYVIPLPIVPICAVVLTLGILGSYLIERSKSNRSRERRETRLLDNADSGARDRLPADSFIAKKFS